MRREEGERGLEVRWKQGSGVGQVGEGGSVREGGSVNRTVAARSGEGGQNVRGEGCLNLAKIGIRLVLAHAISP